MTGAGCRFQTGHLIITKCLFTKSLLDGFIALKLQREYCIYDEVSVRQGYIKVE